MNHSHEAIKLALHIIQLSSDSSTSIEELNLKQNAIELLNNEIRSHLSKESSEG